jgi:vacuolar-type H+-ATPase subunit E/Vma4
MPDINMRPRGRVGRLPRAVRREVVEQLAQIMVETGETRYRRLAALVGVHRSSIAKMVEEARAIIARETDEPPAAARTKLVGRFDKLYREALESYEACKSRGDLKNAAAYLGVANQIVRNEAAVRGIDQMPAQSHNRPAARVIFESFVEPPAAALAAASRLVQAAPRPSALPQPAGEVPNPGVRSEVGQGLGDDGGDDPLGDVLGQREG